MTDTGSTDTDSPDTDSPERMPLSPNRVVAVAVGVVYLAIGVAGFSVSSSLPFFARDSGPFLGVFEVNSFQNVVHLMIGAAVALAGLSSVPAARATNTAVGAFCLVLGILSLFLAGTSSNILALSMPGAALHFATAIVLLGVGLGADQAARSRSASESVS